MSSKAWFNQGLLSRRVVQKEPKDKGLLTYCQGRNSVMQADLLITFERDVMIGHFYPILPAHYVTVQLRI